MSPCVTNCPLFITITLSHVPQGWDRWVAFKAGTIGYYAYQLSIDGVQRIRLMYLHPQGVTDELIDTIVASEKVVNYFDLSLQHVAPEVLKRMGRWGGAERFQRMVSRIRDLDPLAGLRATFGRLTWRAEGALELSTRTGNTSTPDETWSAWSTQYTNATGEQIATAPLSGADDVDAPPADLLHGITGDAAAERRRLPRVRIDKDYRFDGPSGKMRLVDLFEGRDQLLELGRGLPGPAYDVLVTEVRDLDQAFHIERNGDGYRVRYAIADVAAAPPGESAGSPSSGWSRCTSVPWPERRTSASSPAKIWCSGLCA